MINKSTLTSVISKYYLNGLNNQVKWRIKDNQLTIYAGESGRVCKIEHNNFPLEDAELGVFDTHKLSKLISITNGDLMVSLEKIKAVYTKIHFADANFDLTYSLADILILGKNTWYEDPESFEMEFDLTREDIDHLIKAKSALADVNNMLITSTTGHGWELMYVNLYLVIILVFQTKLHIKSKVIYLKVVLKSPLILTYLRIF